MRTLSASLVIALAILVAAPVQAQQVGIDNPDSPSPITLYFHLDARQDFPINTQPPDDRYADSDSRGVLAPTTSCLPGEEGTATSQSFHTLYGFSTPGYVEYDFEEGGGPRIHPERGLANDILVATEEGAEGTWYLKTQFSGGDRRFNALDAEDGPTVVPQAKVRFTLRTGDEVSIGSEAYNQGQLIAQGESPAQDLVPVESEYYHPQEDGSHVFEFKVPLEFEMSEIPEDESFNLRVDMFMDVPNCNADPDESLMVSNVEVFTAPDYRPRLDLSITNALQIVYIHPQFVDNKEIYVHTGFNSPWGNYDVDESPGGVEVSITGPADAKNVVRAAVVQRTHEHGHHFEPVDMTYVWPFKLEDAPQGEYTVTVTAMNDQRTAVATGSAAIEIGPNVAIDSEGNEVAGVQTEVQDTPAIGPLVGLALLGIAFMVRRRRD